MDGELMDPQLRVGAVNVPVDSFSLDAEDMTMLEVGVVQEFQPGKSRRLSRRQMEQLATAMDATALATDPRARMRPLHRPPRRPCGPIRRGNVRVRARCRDLVDTRSQ